MMLDYGLLYRALRTHEIALKQAINDSNRAVAEKAKRPFRAAEANVLHSILSTTELREIEVELSRVAMHKLELAYLME